MKENEDNKFDSALSDVKLRLVFRNGLSEENAPYNIYLVISTFFFYISGVTESGKSHNWRCFPHIFRYTEQERQM